VLHLRLIILSVGGDVPIDSDAFLVSDFVNLKIKSAQSFEVAHRNRMCIYVNRDKCSYVYKYLCLYCICQKKDEIRRGVYIPNRVSFFHSPCP
jgi:hypothetical protein